MNGLSTIDAVRKDYQKSYNNCHIMTKIMLKCWLNHSESRNKNNNLPFTFDNYTNHMDERFYLEQVKLDMIECEDIGGKEQVISYLENRILQ